MRRSPSRSTATKVVATFRLYLPTERRDRYLVRTYVAIAARDAPSGRHAQAFTSKVAGQNARPMTSEPRVESGALSVLKYLFEYKKLTKAEVLESLTRFTRFPFHHR